MNSQEQILTQRSRRSSEGLVAITIAEYVKRHAALNPSTNAKELNSDVALW